MPQNFLEANKRSIYQLLDLIKKTSSGVPKTSRYSQKSDANMFPKKFTPLYLGDLKFQITCCSWKVTKILTHYTFEQARFKRDCQNGSKL